MTEAPIVVSHTRLREFIVTVLTAMKMPGPIAEVTAGHMVGTDLRGVDSHGIGMLPRYHELWQEGYLDMTATPTPIRDELATALWDGQKGLGHYVSTLAMRQCLDKAGTYGVAVVAVRNSGHYGAAANYSMMALGRDMIGLSVTNSPYVAMVPTFGRAAKISTNPISFAAPAGRHAPFVLDMATTTVAVGKLSVAARWKKSIPRGWALDEEGQPTTDPVIALRHRLLSPLGGSRDLGSHKGYGLGVMVDILAGVLAGAVYGDLFVRSDMRARRVQNVGHAFVAIDPARFRPLPEFKRDMDDMFESLKSTPRAEGQARVYVAGEPEAECEQQRRREGIPLAPALVQQCNQVARSLGVAPLSEAPAGPAAQGRETATPR
jgi:LDH2 family malate/lactate/ureidoglycolate dehydrogenase